MGNRASRMYVMVGGELRAELKITAELGAWDDVREQR